jgi:hypothetical protein
MHQHVYSEAIMQVILLLTAHGQSTSIAAAKQPEHGKLHTNLCGCCCKATNHAGGACLAAQPMQLPTSQNITS